MTGSVFLVVVVVVAGLLYLLLRRRGTRNSEGIKALHPSDSGPSREASDLKPFKVDVERTTAGLPPKPKPSMHDSGSSHPAYPVAPAKYSGAVLGRTDQSSRSGTTTGSGSGVHRAAVPPASNPDFSPVSAAQSDPNAPPPAEPWYPEAPAHYRETDERTGSAAQDEPEAGR